MHPPGNQQPSPQRHFLAVLLISLTIKFKAGSLGPETLPLGSLFLIFPEKSLQIFS